MIDMDTIFILLLPILAVLGVFWCASTRSKIRKYQQENGIKLLGRVTDWSKQPFGRQVLYWIEVEASGTIYQIHTYSIHGVKYRWRKNVWILVDQNKVPSSIPDKQKEMLSNIDQLSETLTPEERQLLEAEKQRLLKSFDELNQKLDILEASTPVVLPVLWEDRVTAFNVIFPRVFGVLLLLFEVYAILCLVVEITGIPFPEWFAS